MPIPVQFDGPKRAALRAALLDAFPAPFDMKDLLSDRLNRNFFALVPAYVNYQNQLSELLTRANAEAWIVDLLAAAVEAIPSNPQLRSFAEQVGLASATTQEIADAHQRLVELGVLDVDPALWRARLASAEGQTCRVEVSLEQGPTVYGTGFLLGPSVVITNHHVMEPVYAGQAKPENVVLRFDYKRLPEGVLNPGVIYSLASNWDLDRSDTFRPVEADAPADRLDYALLRLAQNAGEHYLGKKDAEKGEPRGWMTPLSALAFPPSTPLYILQHPKAYPLKLAQSTRGVISVTGGGTRLRHRVNTETGSSGAPCFNQKLELVALHHAGDPDFERPAEWNQAIPFAAILNLLQQRGKQALLGT